MSYCKQACVYSICSVLSLVFVDEHKLTIAAQPHTFWRRARMFGYRGMSGHGNAGAARCKDNCRCYYRNSMAHIKLRIAYVAPRFPCTCSCTHWFTHRFLSTVATGANTVSHCHLLSLSSKLVAEITKATSDGPSATFLSCPQDSYYRTQTPERRIPIFLVLFLEGYGKFRLSNQGSYNAASNTTFAKVKN